PMTKTNKRNLIIVAVVLSVALIAAVCVSVFFPKKTIADLLYLTSKSQIESVTISSSYQMLRDAVGTEEQQQKIHSAHKEITGTPLAQQYIDAIFEKPVALQDVKYTGFVGMGQNYLTTANVYITVTNVGEDYPPKQRTFTISCNSYLDFSDYPEVFLSYDYTMDYRRQKFEENSARGIQEEVKESEDYIFTVPGTELFTAGFIKEQLGIDK
ncbi:hypothetical protein H6A12_11175, partial [Phocea massiliensis]